MKKEPTQAQLVAQLIKKGGIRKAARVVAACARAPIQQQVRATMCAGFQLTFAHDALIVHEYEALLRRWSKLPRSKRFILVDKHKDDIVRRIVEGTFLEKIL